MFFLIYFLSCPSEPIWMDLKDEHHVRNNTMVSYPSIYYDDSSYEVSSNDYSPSNLNYCLSRCTNVAPMNFPGDMYTPNLCNESANIHPYYTYPNRFKYIHAPQNRCSLFSEDKMCDRRDIYHRQQLNTYSFQNMHTLDKGYNHAKQTRKKKKLPRQTKKNMSYRNGFSNSLVQCNIMKNDILQLEEFKNHNSSNPTISNNTILKNSSTDINRQNLQKNQVEEQLDLLESVSQIMLPDSDKSATESMFSQFLIDNTNINSDQNVNQVNCSNFDTVQNNAMFNNVCKTENDDNIYCDMIETTNEDMSNDKNVDVLLKDSELGSENNPGVMLSNNGLVYQENKHTENFILQPFFEGKNENGEDVIVLIAVTSDCQTLQNNASHIPAATENEQLENNPENLNITAQKHSEHLNCQGDFENKVKQGKSESKIHFFSNIYDDFAQEETVQNSTDISDESLTQNVNKKNYAGKSIKNKRNPATKRVIRNKESVWKYSSGFKSEKFQTADQGWRRIIKSSCQKKFNQNKTNATNIKSKLKWKQHFQWRTTKHLLTTYQQEYLEKFVNYKLKNRAIKKDMSKILKIILYKIGTNMLRSMNDIFQDIINIFGFKNKSKFFKATLHKNTVFSKNKVITRNKKLKLM